MIRTGEIKFEDINPKNYISGSGIYAWCVELPKENLNKLNRKKHVQKLIALYNRRIDLKGLAYFESYSGNIEKLVSIDIDRINFEDDETYEFLRMSIKNLCPPLYIGKSSNDLTIRLMKHVNLLNNVMDSNFESEANAESYSQFMNRIKEKEIDKTWLYARYFVVDKSIIQDSQVELQIEYLMNRLINPVLGRN